jgi:4'-phosphopantetheinyl transferase EntD
VITRILPASVVAVARLEDVDARLWPKEEGIVADAVSKRRREFATTRFCAHRALELLGVPAQALLAGADREPIWPPGVVGSITHCEGYRACAVARDSALVTLGIDAEPDLPLPDGVLGTIARPEERERLRALAVHGPSMNWDRLLFSIKESTYKAWFPLAGRWLGFEDASVLIDPERGAFVVELLVGGPIVGGLALHGFEGRWLSTGTHLLTAIASPRKALDLPPIHRGVGEL